MSDMMIAALFFGALVFLLAVIGIVVATRARRDERLHEAALTIAETNRRAGRATEMQFVNTALTGTPRLRTLSVSDAGIHASVAPAATPVGALPLGVNEYSQDSTGGVNWAVRPAPPVATAPVMAPPYVVPVSALPPWQVLNIYPMPPSAPATPPPAPIPPVP